MIEFKLETAAAGDPIAPAVSIIGIGGAGSNVLDHIALEGMEGVELISMNCDARSLASSMAHRKVQLGKSLTQGLGCGGDPELGYEAVAGSVEEIREALGNRQMIFLCAGLGGGTGSGATPTVARLARETGAFVIVFATMPFVFEGKRRMQQAQAALDEIRQYANALVCFENDKMGEIVLPKKGVTEAFEVADRIICQSVRAVTTVATQPGIIRIGMDDLVTALKNADSRCLFGFGQAKGEARASEALQAALKSPLLDRGQLLDKARNVLVHICGGTSLTLFEIETLMRELAKHVSDDAQILFGAASDPRLADSLSVTIISSIGKAKGADLPASAQAAAPRRGPVAGTEPEISAHTQTVPILSVQPRQAPQPPPSSVIAPPALTSTGAGVVVPVLQLVAELPPATPKPAPSAPLIPPEAVEVELFGSPAAESLPAGPEPSTVPPESVEMEEDASDVPAEPLVAEAEMSGAVTTGPEDFSETESSELPEPVEAQEIEEEMYAEASTEIEEEEAEALTISASRTDEMIEPAEEVAESEEWMEEQPIEAIDRAEELAASEELDAIDAEEELEPPPETRHPAFARGRQRLPSAPMRPIEIAPPVKPPAPVRKFDLREILQRQRQTRLTSARGGNPAPAPTPPTRSPQRPPAPARSSPANDRIPDPSRLGPIRPIPASPTSGRATSPFIPLKPPVTPVSPSSAPGSVPDVRGPNRQATFDERLSPTPATRGGRFEKAEPTVEEGEDLDIPTFLRKKK